MSKTYRFIIAAGIVAFSGGAHAAPFITCDSYPATAAQPTNFEYTFNGGAPVSGIAFRNPDNSVMCHHDLASLAKGRYTVTAKACAAGGCSASSAPFEFDTRVPGVPAGMSISPN